MSLRGLRLATQFLTRLPVANAEDFSPSELSRSAAWFPLVGAAIGAVVALLVYLGDYRHALLGAALGVLGWVWLTGALHLDGLADLADALAASHRDRERFLTVLADPRIGAFGAVTLVLALLLKFAALALLSGRGLIPLVLVGSWARLGPLAWGRWLAPLKPGQGERFAAGRDTSWIALWTLMLLAASTQLAPVLCAAPLPIAAWGVWLKRRIGGFSGDCLGAGVEVTEIVLLLALAITSGAATDPH